MATASKRTARNELPDGSRKILKDNPKLWRRYVGFKTREAVILISSGQPIVRHPDATFWEEC